MGEWARRTIGTLGRVVTGKTPPTADHENFDGDYPFITIPDLDGRVWINHTQRSLSEKGAHIMKSCLLPRGAVMMSCIATVGRCGITTKPSFTNQQINSVIPEAAVDPEFLYYAFTRLSHDLDVAGGGGSVYTNVSKSRFSDIEVTIPVDISEQRAIAHILGTLDDKIELNRQMNETLEAMARTLFKSWFIDFDPVRAKAEGRDPGLPADIAALFPDSFEDSELGEIPKGWNAGRLGDVSVSPRRSVRPAELRPETAYIALEHMPRGSIALTEWGNTEGLKSGKFEFEQGEILFGKLRPYFHKVGIAPVDGVCSTDIVVLTPRAKGWLEFVLGHVSSAAFVDYVNSGSTGTKMPRTSWSEMARYPVVMPTEEVVRGFSPQVRPLIDKIITSVHESRSLAALRDELLPQLLAGELRVKDVDKLMEAHS